MKKRANGSLCDNFRTNRYDMEMPVKEKSVLFIESGQLPEDKVLFSVFMERLYDSMLKKAEERQQDVTVMLLDYPYYGGLCGLENIWKKVQRKESVQHCMRMIESLMEAAMHRIW